MTVAIEKLRAALTAAEKAEKLLAAGGPIRTRKAAGELEAARLWAADAAVLLAEREKEAR